MAPKARSPAFWNVMFKTLQRSPSLAAGCAWPRVLGTGASWCGRLGAMGKAMLQELRLWRMWPAPCTGDRMDARLLRSTLRVARRFGGLAIELVKHDRSRMGCRAIAFVFSGNRVRSGIRRKNSAHL